MPILDNWDLSITLDQVLRAQGAEPDSIRSRRPAVIEITNEAIKLGESLIHPQVLFNRYPVKYFIHEHLVLQTSSMPEKQAELTGKFIAQHLSAADEVILMLCTIGNDIDSTISSLFPANPSLAVALDGFGSAAVESLAIEAANFVEKQAKNEGNNTSIPLSPGMIGWPVDEGQIQIFSILDSEQISVSLTESYMMLPTKSLSIVLGIGTNLTPTGTTCDFCNLKGVCRYQEHYAKSN